MWRDVRYGARMLANSPGFTLIVVLTLALGIGANGTIFSLVNALLLRPLPVDKPDQLTAVYTSDFSSGDYGGSSYPDYVDFRDRNDVLEGLVAYQPRPFSLSVNNVTERAFGEVVSGNYFSVLGVKLALGRGFLPEEDRVPGTHPVVVISHQLWRGRYGGDPGVIGRSLTLNGHPFTIVGVAAENYSGLIRGIGETLWVPAMMTDQVSPGRRSLTSRGDRGWLLMGRLREGVTIGQARAAFRLIAEHLYRAWPREWANIRQESRAISLLPESEARVMPQFRLPLALFMALLMAVVGLVLLISCANVANLLLARAAGRRKEIAVRLSLGAGRGRLIRQLLTESLLLAAAGGAAGLLLAVWGSEALLALVPGRLPRAAEAALDGRVLGFTLAASLLTGILFGLAPALQASKPDLTAALKEGGRSVGAGRRASRTRSALIVAQVATAFVLLVGAGLLVNSLLRLQRIEPGFDPERMLSFRVSLPPAKYSEPQQIESFYQGLLTRVGALPGVTAVSATSALPLSGQNSVVGFAVEGVPTPPQTPFPHTSGLRVVRPGYFGTMGIRLLQGRDFDARDTLRSTPVTIINEALARRHFPNQNPIGRRINPSFGVDDRGILFREIIGVVGDVRHSSLREEAGPESYVAHAQAPFNTITVVARAGNDPRALTAAVRGEVRTLDPDLPVFAVRTLEEYLATAVAQPRFGALLLSIFAGVALLLTAVGLYGVISYGVEQRRHEIGVRMALGARARDVLGLVMRQGVALAAAGIGLGLVAAAALTRVMASFLFGVGATDPATFALIALLLGLVALAASYVPALRAARVDPLDALRDQ